MRRKRHSEPESHNYFLLGPWVTTVLWFLVSASIKPALPPSRVLSEINMRTNEVGLCETENRLLPRQPRLGKPPAPSTYSIPEGSAVVLPCPRGVHIPGLLVEAWNHRKCQTLHILCFFLHIRIFSVNGSTLHLLFVISELPASPLLRFGDISKEKKGYLNTSTVTLPQSI